MNNIYVDEVPDSCFYCDFFVRENYCCWLIQKDAREYRDDCPLIPLSDRLAEERKKVVQEIKKLVIESTCYDTEEEVRNHLYDMSASEVLEILDQIERNIDG